MPKRFQMPPYDRDDPESVQYALDQTEIFLNNTTAALEAGIKVHAATPSTSGPTTISTADPLTVTVSEMSITADFGGNTILIFAGGSFSHGTANGGITSEVYDGASAVGDSRRTTTHPTANGPLVHGVVQSYTPAAGSRTISWRWKVSAGTGTARGVERHLVIAELRFTA